MLVLVAFYPFALSTIVFGENLLATIFSLLSLVATSMNLYFCAWLGAGDLSQVTTLLNGPYKVGVQYHTTNKRGQTCLVFYPCEEGGD